MSLLGPRVWKETLYLLLNLAVGTAGFSVIVVGTSVASSLAVTFIGIPVLTITLLLARQGGRLERLRARRLLGVELTEPLPLERGTTLLKKVFAPLQDAAAWRAFAYFLLMFPVGIGLFVATVTWWAVTVSLATLPAWGWALDGHAIEIDGRPYWNDPWQVAVSCVAGIVLLLLTPPVMHALTFVDRALLPLLRRPRSDERIEALETTRARSVDAAVAERRRIERDLHDGAQQRLVALGLDLGLALEKLDTDPAAARELVGGAHREAQRAIVELRDLVRGFAPAVLEDRGLDAALSALAARSPVPVALTIDVPRRPPASVEANAYFIVAEALTNIARHAAAGAATVVVKLVGGPAGAPAGAPAAAPAGAASGPPRLRIEIADNGRGGADPALGSGLEGLAARAAAVDGSFTVESPAGGGTRIVAEMPCGS